MSDALPPDLEVTLAAGPRDTAASVIARLRDLRWTIGVAESLTGGLVVARLVDVPGASDVVRGGVVAYATDVKASLLGVDATLLEAHGPVNPRVAAQMAEGARTALGQGDVRTDVGVSTTGIAGPRSPDGQPVGTVHVGVATALGQRVESTVLRGSRAEIRDAATAFALRCVLAAL